MCRMKHVLQSNYSEVNSWMDDSSNELFLQSVMQYLKSALLPLISISIFKKTETNGSKGHDIVD